MKKMVILGDCLALGITLLVAMVYFQGKHFLTMASKYYAICLLLTAVSSIADIFLLELTRLQTAPVLLIEIVAFVDLIIPIATTSFLGLYLISKLLEHTFDNSHTTISLFVFSFIMVAFAAIASTNIWTGWVYSAEEGATFDFKNAFILIYTFIVFQILVVFAFGAVHHKSISNRTRKALFHSVVGVCVCIVLRICNPTIHFLNLGISLVELVFFLHFQSQRIGVNTLTKLNDRRRFFLEIESRIKLGSKFRAYLIRIGNFGVINQTYGHSAGDEVLYQIAFALERLFLNGVAFHIHSTTFAIVLPGDDEDDKYIEKLLRFTEEEIKYMDSRIKLDYSIAEHILTNDTEASTFYEKLSYTAYVVEEKKLRYAKYTPELGEELFRRKYLISRMQSIDADHGFEVWFQPIYSVNKGKFSSMETLIRLRESDGTLISPAEFIPLAEKTDLIVPITWFVIDQTCKTLAQNPWLGNIRASINLPMVHLLNPKLNEKLNEIVDKHGIPHERISFEFTERAILDDLETASRNMKKLAESGYSFYLDDFGVGYSNFNCVLQLPLKTVKLDMSLTATAERLRENYGLVNALTDLFHDMGLNVVAEGAETEEQVDLLKGYGVDGIQGYYFAKPMSISKLKDFHKANRAKFES